MGHWLQRQEPGENFIRPGFGCIPEQPVQLQAVVSSGILVTFFDTEKQIGGMVHFARPLSQREPTAFFAEPALVWLAKSLEAMDLNPSELHFQVIGAAEQPNHKYFEEGLANKNIRITMTFLRKLGCPAPSLDVGGQQGRKVLFDTATGSCVVARTQAIRKSDWYPGLQN